DLLQERSHPGPELHLRWLEEGRLPLLWASGGRVIDDGDPLERPQVGSGHLLELLATLGERHVEDGLARPCTLDQEAHGESRVPGPRVSPHEVETATGEASAEHVVQPGGPRAHEIALLGILLRFSHGPSGLAPPDDL